MLIICICLSRTIYYIHTIYTCIPVPETEGLLCENKNLIFYSHTIKTKTYVHIHIYLYIVNKKYALFRKKKCIKYIYGDWLIDRLFALRVRWREENSASVTHEDVTIPLSCSAFWNTRDKSAYVYMLMDSHRKTKSIFSVSSPLPSPRDICISRERSVVPTHSLPLHGTRYHSIMFRTRVVFYIISTFISLSFSLSPSLFLYLSMP